MKKNLTEVKNKILMFFNRENIHKQLSAMVSYIIPHRSDLLLNLNIGGGSYTDNKKIVVGLPEIFLDLEFKQQMIILLALTGHESQHVVSSNFEEFSNFINWTEDYFAGTEVPGHISRRIGKTVGNSIEDGRIEKILVNNLPGFLKKIKFLNASIWKLQDVPESELSAFLYTITTLSVMGIYPKGYEDKWLGTRLDDNIKRIENHIKKGIEAYSCKEGLDICKEIIEITKDYIETLVDENIGEGDKIAEMLDEIPEHGDFTSSSEEVKNDKSEISSHLSQKKDSSKQNSDKTKNRDSKEGDNKKSDDETASNTSSSKSNESKEDEKSDESSNGESSSDESESNNSSSDESESNNSSSDSDSDEKLDSKDNNSSSNKKTEDNHPSESSNSSNSSLEDNDDFKNEDLIDDILKEIESELSTEISEKLKEPKANKSKKEEDCKTPNLEDIKEVENLYRQDSYNKLKVINGFPTNLKLSDELTRQGNAVRKKIEKIFKNKEVLSLNNQSKGILNQNDLWKVNVKDYNVFSTKGHKSKSDYVAYLLQDGSGSMSCDNKQYYSGSALSIMEHAFKGLIPFKITTFSTSSTVLHYTVKDFNQNSSNINYSYNFMKNRRATGGNKDGFSIRIATKELLSRPEKDKILIVLSDGIPTDYRGGEAAGMRDVKEAVKEARKAGIFVVSIVFGTEEYRQASKDKYVYMYEKNIISCPPALISSNLIKILGKIVSR